MPYSDDPDRFVVGAVFETEEGRMLAVRGVKPYKDRGLLVRFEGVRSREEAERLRGSLLTIDAAARRALESGEYWPEQLVGLTAVTPAGEILGRIAGVEFGPGQDRLAVITAAGTEVLVPFVSAIVGDPEGDRIVIEAPEGLF